MSNLKSKYEIKFVDNKSDAMNSNHKRFSHLSENLMNENEIFKEKKLNISCEINQNYFDKFFSSINEENNNYKNSDNKNNASINSKEIKNEKINDINFINENNLKTQLNQLLEENNLMKIELEEYKNKNLECKYHELLIDYQKIETQNNNLIEQNESLKNINEEISKELNNYKNKYNLILKEQKKTKNSLEEISIKYNSHISFIEKCEQQKITIEKLIQENKEIKNEIEIFHKKNLEEKLSNLTNDLNNKISENKNLKEFIRQKEDEIEKNINDIKSLKDEVLNLNKEILKKNESNINIQKKYDILNNDYILLKEQNLNIEYIKNDFEKKNISNLEKIKALENSNENYIKEINEIKLKNEEYKNNYEEQIEIYKNKNLKNEETYNEEINKLKKEIDILNLEIGNLKLKFEQKNNENNNLISQNEEINIKLNKIEKDAIKSKETYDNIIKEKDEIILLNKSQLNKINEEIINIMNKNKHDIKNINDIIKTLQQEKKILFNKAKEIILENTMLSQYYQENLNKLKNIQFLNNEITNSEQNIFIGGILESKDIFDFISKCSDEIIKLTNEKYILKNNINNLDLKLNLKNEQINDYEKEISNLKSIINNYTSEFDNKNKIFNQMKSKNNDIEHICKKISNDKKILLDILLRIIKLFPNSKIENLIYNIIKDDNSNEKDFLEKQNQYSQIFKEIQLLENYIFELMDKRTKVENIKNKSINNNIIINNNISNIESINSKNNIKNIVDKIYLKKLYNKKEAINKIQGKEKHK